MFSVSLFEIFVILLVALIFFKPKDFINIISNTLKIIKQIKNYVYNLQNDFNKIEVLNNFDDYVVLDKKNNKKP